MTLRWMTQRAKATEIKLIRASKESKEIEETIEKKTPIGVKLVFSKWKSGSGEIFWDVDMVYQTTQQLRNVDILDENDHPASVDIEFNGLKQNKDSLYSDKDLKNRLKESIAEYDSLAEYN